MKEMGKGTTELVRNRVITEEAEEFLKVIRNSEYSMIQQLNKLPAQISILALLLSFEVHYNALLKVLKDTRVPTSATESALEGMVSIVLATNQISFTDDELPPKGRDHTLPMHIIVKCEGMVIAKVLIDNGSALNFCPMSTLECLNVVTCLICPTTMIIRAFDGTLKEVQGETEWGQGLSAVGHGNASLIKLPDDKGGFILGYKPFDEELFQASRGKKRKCIGYGMSIPHIRVTFLASAEVIVSKATQESCEEESYLACLIRLCLEELSVYAIISLGDDLTTTIRPYVPCETVGHWTVKPYFVVAPANKGVFHYRVVGSSNCSKELE
ncbi:hypothetical protein SO802_017459 [Lithocarpus litseifolius]|uniref:Uncharacterized protein n=1 Tax=Lithocarpus litseifolius TaxID=425828 RepID=A0AAW2CJD4_9ROSI